MDVDITNDIIVCVLESYEAKNLSCVIQAIFELQRGNCSNNRLEYPNYAYQISSNVSIAHLPRNQIFCFVAEANNTTSTMILMGTFTTPAGSTN